MLAETLKSERCKSCTSRQELSENLLAKFGVDKTENEPLKLCQQLAKNSRSRGHDSTREVWVLAQARCLFFKSQQALLIDSLHTADPGTRAVRSQR